MSKLLLIFCLLISFFSYTKKAPALGLVAYSVTNCIDFYPGTDSLRPESYPKIDSVVRYYQWIKKGDFFIRVIPIRSTMEINSFALFEKRIEKFKLIIKKKYNIKVRNIKVNQNYYSEELGNVNGFVFWVEPKQPGRPYKLRK